MSKALRRQCVATTNAGGPCGAPPQHDREFCRIHDPEQAEAVAEGRRMGGIRRRKETVLGEVYDFRGFRDAMDVLRLLEITVADTLALPNSSQRSRVLTYAGDVALRALDQAELSRRLAELEAVLHERRIPTGPAARKGGKP